MYIHIFSWKVDSRGKTIWILKKYFVFCSIKRKIVDKNDKKTVLEYVNTWCFFSFLISFNFLLLSEYTFQFEILYNSIIDYLQIQNSIHILYIGSKYCTTYLYLL